MYHLTEEHKNLIPAHNQYWIDNAFSTRRIKKEEKPIIKELVKKLYKCGGLKPPPDHRIIFVPSPFVARFAGGFAAWIWHCRKKASVAARAATDAATRAATHAATHDAAWDATWNATWAATDDATRDATHDATRDATYDATDAATRDATDAATDAATRVIVKKKTNAPESNNYWYYIPGGITSIVKVAKKFGNPNALLKCAYYAYKMYQGGNFWSATSSFIEFGRNIAKLNSDYSKWDCYKQLSELSSYRIMHKEFCLISERPTVLKVNSQNQPHCATGPFCEWADGSALYALNGVRVPKWLVDTPAEQIDPVVILKEENAEVCREIVRKIGIERVCIKLGAECISKSPDGMYELLLLKVNGSKYEYLKMRNPSIGTYHLEGVKDCTTWQEALEYRKPPAMKKIPISENGADWYQQGDVYIWPRKARFLKPFPKVLT